MTNYSARKSKSVSLNNQEEGYDNQNNNVSHDSSSVHSIDNNSSEVGSSPEMDDSSKKQPDVQKSASVAEFDWLATFHRTFLSIYLVKDDPLVGSGQFDYAFRVGEQLLYVLTHEQIAAVDSPNVSKAMLADLRLQAATYINDRFQQIAAKVELPIANEQQGLDKIHYIGLTSLTLVHEGNSYQIEHEFGSTFFKEACPIDLADKNKVLQLFSLNSFYKTVQLLQTPSDLLSYFDHHLSKLVNIDDFQGEFELAQAFLNSPDFYQRAIEIQQKLVEIGLLAKVETRLTNLINTTNNNTDDAQLAQNQIELTQKLQSHSTIFQKLLNGTTKRRHDAGDMIPLDQVKILVAESMYTRIGIIEEMMAYENRSREECLNGYLCHQHSYNDFGQHYVIVVYGLDENAEYSKDYLQQNYRQLLTEINAELQDPVMKEYFILGFDMSNNDGQGNVTVMMDIYHQSGFVV